MREAKERVEANRAQENQKRAILGQDPLPRDTIHIEV